jgi:pyridoxamine 5'-phosphate oxidase
MTAPVPPRLEYRNGALAEADVAEDPMMQLRRWLDDAIANALPEPTAITLATADAAGLPDARIVLLRGLDEHGIWWFTNRRSAKGEQLAANPVAAVVAHWQPLERQVRLRGRVELLPDAVSDGYFAGRPRASQVAAWASDQSRPVRDRPALEAQVATAERRFEHDEVVARPEHWGGYLLRPDTVEFWQGRPARLHDRLRYRREGQRWTLQRLQP